MDLSNPCIFWAIICSFCYRPCRMESFSVLIDIKQDTVPVYHAIIPQRVIDIDIVERFGSLQCSSECYKLGMGCITAVFNQSTNQCSATCDVGHYGYTNLPNMVTMMSKQEFYQYDHTNIAITEGLGFGHAVYLYGYLGSNLWKTYINLQTHDLQNYVYHMVFDHYGTNMWISTANTGNGWNYVHDYNYGHELHMNSRFFIKLEGTESEQLKITLNGESYVLINRANIPMSEVGWVKYAASSANWVPETTLEHVCIV